MSTVARGATKHVILSVRYLGAGWTCPGVERQPDMADFGPPVDQVDLLACTPLSPGKAKPVLYLPVPRRGGKELFPDLQLQLLLGEPDVRGLNVEAKAWDGAEVRVEVSNVWDPSAARTVAVKGKLRGGFCVVRIPADVVERWFAKEGKDGKGSGGSQAWSGPGESSGDAGTLSARVNENLLDFAFRIPAIAVDGKPFSGVSHNRLFLYRRKNIVFFPGVFGSNLEIKTSDGRTVGFPNFSAVQEAVRLSPDGGSYAAAGTFLANLIAPIQRIGALECDAGGRPLAEPEDPKLLMMTVPVLGKPIVYDPFQRCHDAVRARLNPLPPGFRLYTLWVHAYDWRKDLTETALASLDDLERIQRDSHHGVKAPDGDDQLAVVGHSTGGVIIRRMLADERAGKLISHAFFMNVPFRGAPKTLPVIATGRDPLDGNSMIPFVDPKSLRAMALTAPIVYHLSPSAAYRNTVLVVSTAPPRIHSFPGMAGVNEWVRLGIATGFIPSRKVVPADAPLSSKQRAELASRADTWNAFWEERFERSRGWPVIRSVLGQDDPWVEKQLAARGLKDQDALRREQGWSDALARKADEFHGACEKMAGEGKWGDRCFVFYSVAHEPTTMRVEARLVFAKRYSSEYALLEDAGMKRDVFSTGMTLDPPCEEVKPSNEGKAGDELVERGVFEVERWFPLGPGYVRERWRLATLNQKDGDGTVPLASLIGFGGKANVFRRLVDDEQSGTGPVHTAAANHPWAWARIVEVLHGDDPGPHLADPGQVDGSNGIDSDERLAHLRDRYARAGK